MSLINSEKVHDSFFYEADIFNIGAESKNKAGRASEQQEILSVLSTDNENKYPRFIKLRLVRDYAGNTLKNNIEKVCILSLEAKLNTDGEKGFNTLNEKIQVNNEKENTRKYNVYLSVS